MIYTSLRFLGARQSRWLSYPGAKIYSIKINRVILPSITVLYTKSTSGKAHNTPTDRSKQVSQKSRHSLPINFFDLYC